MNGVAELTLKYLQASVENTQALLEYAIRTGRGEAVDPPSDANIQEIREQAQQAEVLLPIERLARTFALGPAERSVILLAVSSHLDSRMRQLCQTFYDSPMRDGVDVELCTWLLAENALHRIHLQGLFRPGNPLVDCGLVEISPLGLAPSNPLLAQVKPAPELLAYLSGQLTLPPHLASWTRFIAPTATAEDLVLEDPGILDELATVLGGLSGMEPEGRDRSVMMLLAGPSGSGKSLLLEAAADRAGLGILEAKGSALRLAGHDAIRDLLRIASASGTVLCLDGADVLLGEGSAAVDALITNLTWATCPVTITVMDQSLVDRRVSARCLFDHTLTRPAEGRRARIWRVHLAKAEHTPEVDPVELAELFPFYPGHVARAVRLATSLGRGRPISRDQLLRAAWKCVCEEDLRKLSLFEPSSKRLGDLVLPEDTARQVTEIREAMSARLTVLRDWGLKSKLGRGFGMIMLFDGEPGTGKTLCAEILANELGLHLQRVNAAAVVDKYIGETEKNLTAIFANASARTLLLFDEADGLFAGRTQVKQANDRFANQEVAVLLQLVERHEGVVVLTTNLKKSIDEAFKRRITFHIHFPFPGPKERERLWQTLLPDRAYLAPDLDLKWLAETFELAGGGIKNAILRASYAAAARKKRIDDELLAEMATRESIASGHLVRHEIGEGGLHA
ncbi:MAG: AAA family ATPase [Bradymonadales bacterium]|nr:AAA family ATPase [Bradymonadales bacterium]